MSRSSDFLDFVDAFGLGTGDAVAAIHAFFDESGRDRWFCVAGYVFKKSKLKLFEREWGRMIRANKLPYFRMSACNARQQPFDKMSSAQCIAVATEAISLIKKYASIGIAIALDPVQFEETMRNEVKNSLLSTAYEHCVWMSLVGVRTWAEDSGHKGSIGYFFEAGQEHQTKANRLMKLIFDDNALNGFYRYGGHGFVAKESFAAQAADLLSWQFRKECERLSEGEKRPPRKDFVSLMQLSHQAVMQQPDEMYRSRAESLRQFPSSQLRAPERAS